MLLYLYLHKYKNMKKLILTILASSFLLSCSTDSSNDDSNNSSNLLPSKIIFSGPTATGIDNNSVANFEYSGSKILRTFYDDNSETIFTYSGDLITNAVTTGVSNGVPFVINQIYTYDNNNRLILYTKGSSKIEYTYLTNNQVSEKTYELDNNSGQFEQIGDNIITLNSNNEIVEVAYNNLFGGEDYIETYVYENRNNPFKNIIGHDKIYIIDKEGNSHNVLNISRSNGLNYREYFYTYNDLNYPVTRQGTGGTIQYFYD